MKKEKSHQDLIDILALKRLRIYSENGDQIMFASLWEHNPVVVVFIRHFGCIACRAHVSQVWEKKEEIEKKGTRIVFIGNGSHVMIKGFKEDLKIPDATIYTDPTLKTFDAAGMLRGIFHIVSPRSVIAMTNLAIQGHRQARSSKETGYHTQLGGVLAIKKPGIVTYHFVSEYIGDFDHPEEWL